MISKILSDIKLTPDQFHGKVALVTGGARGIGETAARYLASLGARVVVADVSSHGQRVVDEINAKGGEAVFVHTDMSSLDSIDSLVQACLLRYGQIDILLSSAARLQVQTISNFSPDAWDDSYFTNLRGPTCLISRLLPGMIERRYGVILALISLEGAPFIASYCAQKLALRSMLMSLAKELPADAGVCCVAVMPGSVDTPLIHETVSDLAAASGLPAATVMDMMKNNPGYEGLVPVEHSAASCLYFIAHADKYHGQFVDGYLPLHEHGVIDAAGHAHRSQPTASVMPNPEQELGKFVRTNIEIERRVKERTNRLEEEKSLLHLQSLTDALTGLPNRLLLEDRLRQALADARRHGTRIALMFIDLDEFKPINDNYGHEAGDLLLQEAARRMQERLRQTDTIARVGGDEFVVLLPVIEREQYAKSIAEEIRAALNRPFQLADRHVCISSSIGIAVYPEHGSDEKALLRNADAAMYAAKSSGRNKVRIPEQIYITAARPDAPD